MKNAIPYIKAELEKLIQKFPFLRVRYEVDKQYNSHFVEVLPLCEFKSNEEYAKFETEFILNFISFFPDQEIVFLSSDSLIKIKEPIFELSGILYSKKMMGSLNWSKSFISYYNGKNDIPTHSDNSFPKIATLKESPTDIDATNFVA